MVAECAVFALGILAGLAPQAPAQDYICDAPDYPGDRDVCRCEFTCNFNRLNCIDDSWSTHHSCTEGMWQFAKSECRTFLSTAKGEQRAKGIDWPMSSYDENLWVNNCADAKVNGETSFQLEISWPPALPVVHTPGYFQGCHDTQKTSQGQCWADSDKCFNSCLRAPKRPAR